MRCIKLSLFLLPLINQDRIMKKFLIFTTLLLFLTGCDWFGVGDRIRDKLPENYTMAMHDYQVKIVQDVLLPYGMQQWHGYFATFFDAYTDPVTGDKTPPLLALSHFMWYPQEYGPDFWNDCGVDYIDNYTFDTFVYSEENGIITVRNLYGRDWHGTSDGTSVTLTCELGTIELNKLEQIPYDGSLDNYIDNLLNR